MKRSKIKTLLLTGVAVIGLSGAFAWNYFTPPSHAAEGHGDEHGHTEGEEQHAEAHRQMLRNDKIRSAVQAFARAVKDSLHRDEGAVILYANGMDDTIPLNDRISRNVLFRRDGGAWRPVFVDPFKMAIIADKNHHEQLRRDAVAMIARLSP